MVVMRSFKIIPVIDILNSKAVHAIKGERVNYKPLKSHLFKSSNPIEIIKVLNHKYSFNEFYIADLDSILKKKPNFRILKKILDIASIKVIIDPGIVNLKDILQFSKIKFKGLILGLETIKNIEIISQSLKVMGQNKVIVSFDMYKGEILSNAKDLKNQNPLKLIKKIETLGIKELILLDLYRVGQKLGGIPRLYTEIMQNYNGRIFVGGGIKNYNDILDYKEQNFSGVLIATALYDGTINIEKLRKFL